MMRGALGGLRGWVLGCVRRCVHSCVRGCVRGCVLAGALLPAAGPLHAEPMALTICYDYGCKVQEEIRFTDAVFDKATEVLATADDALSERHAIAAVVAHMYVEAGKLTPIWRDHGGDSNDEGIGSMDCIDHAANTTTFLKLLEARGLLRFHDVGEPVRRGIFAEHWAAQLRERGANGVYTVDSWYYEFGMPAIVMSLADWRRGIRPPGISMGFR